MKSLRRFLAFVAFLGCLIGLLYLGRMLFSGGEKQAVVQPAVQPTAAQPVIRTDLKFPGLAALDGEWTGLVNHTLPSVVSISAVPESRVDPRFQVLLRSMGFSPASPSPDLGSGVLVSSDGYVVTNVHVIQRAATVVVHLNDGRALPATYVGADVPSDIAVIKIQGENFQPLPFGNSDDVNVGQIVFAVGNPMGLQETVTQGIISARGRRSGSEVANEYFQTDAAINPGNSGGPLINLKGEVIGINNSILAQSQGIGFSIPSNIVQRVFESIRDNGRFIRPWFGARMQRLSPERAAQIGDPALRGVEILIVEDNSPAQRAGLRPGDVVVEFNGHPINDQIDLRNRLIETAIGKTVDIRIRRGSADVTLKAVIEPEPGA